MKYKKRTVVAFLALGFMACGGGAEPADSSEPKVAAKSMYESENVDPMENPGIGPVKELTLPAEINQEMAATGKEIYELKCTACHKVDIKHIGPPPVGIFERRNPAWIMNMILNPEQMVSEDPIAKKLFMEFNASPMANQNLTETEARSVVEYFRTL